VVTGKDDLHERYTAAVCSELEAFDRPTCVEEIASVFFGGGTPTRLDARLLERVLATARSTLGIAAGAEITVEANPGTTDATRYADLRQMGFNRISIGAQSFFDDGLRLLGRDHTAADALDAFRASRRAGFDNVSLDLIFSIPGATTLDVVIDLRPEHISTYALTLEEGTSFHRRARSGDLPVVGEDDDARQYIDGIERLTAAGYEHYEISNFALPGRRSRHNWAYWTGGEYIGIGLSAHSYVGGRRSWNIKDLTDYLTRVEAGSSPLDGEETLDPAAATSESIWLGLRTCEGVRLGRVEREGLAAKRRMADLVSSGFVHPLHGDRMKLTAKGMPVADAVSVEIVTMIDEIRNQAA
jgi:oxygen-independent coproporphyrinogen-3 oxidase